MVAKNTERSADPLAIDAEDLIARELAMIGARYLNDLDCLRIAQRIANAYATQSLAPEWFGLAEEVGTRLSYRLDPRFGAAGERSVIDRVSGVFGCVRERQTPPELRAKRAVW